MKKILLLAFLVLSLKSTASHLSGGWIETEVINSTTLKVRLKLITDCSGISLNYTSETIYLNGITSVLPASSFSLTFVDTANIEIYCANTLSTCNGGANLGYRLWTYEGFVAIPPSLVGSNVRLYYENCCRPGGVVNLIQTNNYAIYTDLFALNTIKNNSPIKFSYDILAQANDTSVISYSFVDLEADSLNYQLSQPLEDVYPITASPLASGYSVGNPLGVGLYSNLNSATGNYTFKAPPAVGSYAVAFDVIETRNGTMLSKMHGEQVILVAPINIPNAFDFSASGDSYKAFEPCNADTVTYTANFNVNDSIVITIDSLNLYPGATFTVSNTSPTQKIAKFVWQPGFSSISLKPGKVVFRVAKYACPYVKKLTYTTKFNINPCPIDSVWPGDINLDKTVNLIDGIYLAVAYNETGAPRVNPTINWTPQFATNWTNNFAVGSNYKHADCDGNGTVNLLDALAIAQNFGLVHAKMGSYNSGMSASTVYDPTVNLGTATAPATNSIVSMPVTIGDATKKVLGGNAVLFKINGNPSIIDATTLVFTPNAGIIANVNDIVTTQYIDQSNADLYIAFVKKNGGTFSGNGVMGTLSFKIKANASLGNTSLTVDQPQLFAPKMYGMPVKPGPVKVLNVVTGLNTLASLKTLSITPNPFKNNFKVANDKVVSAYEIMDVTGKVILQKNINATNFEVQTEQLNQGVYFLKLNVNGKALVSKLVKE